MRSKNPKVYTKPENKRHNAPDIEGSDTAIVPSNREMSHQINKEQSSMDKDFMKKTKTKKKTKNSEQKTKSLEKDDLITSELRGLDLARKQARESTSNNLRDQEQ